MFEILISHMLKKKLKSLSYLSIINSFLRNIFNLAKYVRRKTEVIGYQHKDILVSKHWTGNSHSVYRQ